jgi:hypothetical protein
MLAGFDKHELMQVNPAKAGNLTEPISTKEASLMLSLDVE